MAEAVVVDRAEIAHLEVGFTGGLLVSNPPWGRRISDREQLGGLYRQIGDSLKQRAAGNTAWLLVGDSALAKQIGLRPSRRLVLFDGPVECRLLRFELYEGSRERRSSGVE